MRGAKYATAKVEARTTVSRKSRKIDGSTELPLKQRLEQALEQHAAVSAILQVISASPSDVRPVLDAVAERAARLCEAPLARVLLVDGDVVRVLAEYSLDGTPQARTVPLPCRRTTIVGRAVLDRVTIHHDDVVPLLESEYPDAKKPALRLGIRAVLAVPLMREGNAYGAIFLWRREPGLFSHWQVTLVETFAQQAAIAVDNVRLFNETKEALERQTATSEILRVISQSPTDVQPVFEAIAAAALKLCNANSAAVLTFDGKLMRLGALANVSPNEADAVRLRYPKPPGRETAASRAILTGSTVVVPDVLEDAEFEVRARSFRSVVSVPLMREGSPIGAITVGRVEPGPFPDTQIALLQTFADQAVIAIENVRLFNETKEALERQSASAEVLAAISSSIADTEPVFDRILASCEHLFAGKIVGINVVGEDGLLRVAAYQGQGREEVEKTYPAAIDDESASGVVMIRREVLHLPDVDGGAHVPPVTRRRCQAMGIKAAVVAPLLWESRGLGSIFVGRDYAGPFSDNEIALLKTFADQAVIAIQNARLFNETKEALEQQTATAEILQAISSSPGNLQPVLDILVRAAARFCGAPEVLIMRLDDGVLRSAAGVGSYADAVKRKFGHFEAMTLPLTKGSVAGRALLERRTIHVNDLAVESEDEYPEGLQLQRQFGSHTVVATPLLREGVALGTIALVRMEVKPFSERQIQLLRAFADQAVIAIENVRLFEELEQKTAELMQSVGELKALGEVGQAVSSTLDLATVLSTIVARAVQLAGMDAGAIYEYDEVRGEFYLHTADRLPDEVVTALRAGPIPKGEGALGRMAMTGDPTEIRDIMTDASYQSRLRGMFLRLGYRSLMAVPLTRDDHLLGGLVVYRKTPGEFEASIIDLLKTFATQSALAIQNARLFREIEDKSRQLEKASQHKSEFLANMSHELRTPLNAIIGFSEVLSERMFGEINEKQAEYIGDILQSGQHLLSLINDILDLSKIEAGRMELEATAFHLPSVIENALTLVRERAQRHGITLGHTVDERLGMIRADERKVKQVLLNLLSNALKFTPEGGRIDVRAAVRDGTAEISVTDTGVGISPEDQAAVFEEFRQVGTAAKKVEGTGLGLAISRKFIELHGGRIWVKSQLGTGSTFAFALPLQ